LAPARLLDLTLPGAQAHLFKAIANLADKVASPAERLGGGVARQFDVNVVDFLVNKQVRSEPA
jgi:hypothetical protein